MNRSLRVSFVHASFVGAALTLALALLAGCEEASLGPDHLGDIDGQVQDAETGAPLAGAGVTTSPATSALVTDADGRFRLGGLEAGSYTISARKPGYRTASVPVAVRGDRATPAALFLELDGDSTSAAAGADSLHVEVVNWANRAAGQDTTFVDAEYQVRNIGAVDLRAYEVYFRIRAGGETFYHEVRGDNLTVGQADVARFEKYIRNRSADAVAVDAYWLAPVE